MAITAKFVADFDSFNREAQQATREIENVAKAADKTADSLSKLTGGSAASSFGEVTGSIFKTAAALDTTAASAEDTVGRFARLRGGLNDVADGAGLTVGQLGLFNSAVAVGSAALAGWNIGRKISELLGLDDVIGRVTSRLIGFGNVAAQEAGAKADVLALASQRAKRSITDFSEALQVNAAFVEDAKARGRELADVLARLEAPHEFTEQIRSWHAEIASLSDAGVLPALKAGLASGVIGVKELSDSYRVSVGAVQLFKKELDDEEKAHAKSVAAVKAHNAELARHEAQQQRLEAQYQKSVEALRRFEDNIGVEAAMTERLTKNLKGLGAELPVLDLHTSQFGASSFVVWNGIRDGVEKVNGVIGLMPDLSDHAKQHLEDLGHTKSIFDDLKGSINSVFQSAFEGGGGTKGATQSLATRILGGTDEDPGLLSKFGKIGAVLGPFAGALVSGVSALFGKLFDNPEKKINPIREAFVQAAGGLDELNKKAADAGITLDHLLNAKNARQYQAAIDELGKTFAVQEANAKALGLSVDGILGAAQNVGGSVPTALQPILQKLLDMKGLSADAKDALQQLADTGPDFNKLEGLASGLGITLQQLGPKFQTAHLDALGHQYEDAFNQLTDAGADVGGVLEGLSPKINALLGDATKFGSSVPESMKPMLQKMLDLGLLTDDSGKKLASLAGFNFDDSKSPLDKATDKLTKALDHLATLLEGLPGIAGTAATGIAGAFNGVAIDVPVHFNVDDVPDFGRPIPMASGGMGRVTKPTLFLAGEAGAEDYAFSGGGKSFGGKSFAGASQITMADMLDELRRLRQDLPRAMRDAVLLAN